MLFPRSMPADLNAMSRVRGVTLPDGEYSGAVRRPAVKGMRMEHRAGMDRRPPHLPLLAAWLLAAVSISICGSRAAAQGTAGLLREKQPQLCYSCHRDVEAEFKLPVRHPVNQGLVKCTDCHNHSRLADGSGLEECRNRCMHHLPRGKERAICV